MSVTGFVVVAGSVDTIYNLFLHPGAADCGGIQSVLPAVPPSGPDGGCPYNGAADVYGVIIMVAALT